MVQEIVEQTFGVIRFSALNVTFVVDIVSALDCVFVSLRVIVVSLLVLLRVCVCKCAGNMTMTSMARPAVSTRYVVVRPPGRPPPPRPPPRPVPPKSTPQVCGGRPDAALLGAQQTETRHPRPSDFAISITSTHMAVAAVVVAATDYGNL